MGAAMASHTEETAEVASGRIYVLKGGRGRPLLVLHDDVGGLGWLPFHQELASHFTVYAPSHPGYGKSERPQWMRNVRDLAVVHNWLLKVLGLDSTNVVGLGFGGWVAAEMATMNQRQFERMVLVGPMGIQPSEGEIADQFLLSGEEYARLGFHDQAKFEELYGSEPSLEQNESWEINREMTSRIAWKPYMFNQALPVLLQGVDTPTLVVWGGEDKIAPLSCGQRYVEALPNARLHEVEGCGHSVDMESPNELAALVADFITESR